jgi:hypothetical protein
VYYSEPIDTRTTSPFQTTSHSTPSAPATPSPNLSLQEQPYSPANQQLKPSKPTNATTIPTHSSPSLSPTQTFPHQQQPGYTSTTSHPKLANTPPVELLPQPQQRYTSTTDTNTTPGNSTTYHSLP